MRWGIRCSCKEESQRGMIVPRVQGVTQRNQTVQQNSWRQNKTNLIMKELSGVKLTLKEKKRSKERHCKY